MTEKMHKCSCILKQEGCDKISQICGRIEGLGYRVIKGDSIVSFQFVTDKMVLKR